MPAQAQTAPAWQWAQRVGGSGLDFGNNVAVDGSGNVYVVGQFSDAATFGTTMLTSRGGGDAYLAKYSHSGTLLWVQQIGGLNDDNSSGIGLDAAGNVYLSGFFTDAALIGANRTMTSAGGIDIFVAKFSPAGDLQWAQTSGGPGLDISVELAVDASGAVLVTGYYNGSSCTFGTTTLPGSGRTTMLVAKLNPAGSWVWAKGSTSSDYAVTLGHGVALSPLTGEVYVTGVFWNGSASWGPFSLNPGSFGLSYQARLSAGGTWLGVIPVASGSDSFVHENVAIDAVGNVYQASSFKGTITLGSTTLTSVGGSQDGVVVKYSPAGAVLWARQLGGTGTDAVQALTLDATGNVYVGGHFTQAASFGPFTLSSPSPSSGDTWVSKLTPAGTWQWVRQAGSTGLDYCNGLSVDAAGNVFATGTYILGSITLGTFTLPYFGQQDIFLARLGNAPLATAAGLPRLTLSAYPNPAREQTTITLEPGPAGVATVVDALGRTVREQAFPANTRQLALRLEGVPAGVYRVLLTGTAQLRTLPLVVQ